MRLPPLGTVRPPFIAVLAATALLGGLIILANSGVVTLPHPSQDHAAAVLAGSVVKLTNEERAESDLPPLTASALLTRAAQMKADDMAAKSYYAHVSPDGSIPPYWLNAVGYKYQIMAENLVIDRTNSEDVVSAWMGSHDHRVNILNPAFTEIGIGVAHGTYEGDRTIYVVQMLAKPLRAASVAQQPAPRTAPKPVPAPKPMPVTTPAPKPAPKPVPVTPPVPEPAPAPTLPAVTARPTPVVPEAPAPVLTVADPLAPILEGIATTTPFTLPAVATTSAYPAPVLSVDTSAPVQLRAPTPDEAPAEEAATASLSARALTFARGVAAQVVSFFNP